MTCTWYFAIIPARNISNFSKYRGILDNFEISLAVLLPNTTTGHAITCTYTTLYNSQLAKM